MMIRMTPNSFLPVMLRLLASFLTYLYCTILRCVFRLPWVRAGPTKFTLPPIDDPALVQSANTLALWIRQRRRTSESIVKAFIKRAKAVNPIINAIIDERFQAALREAQEVDHLLDACTREEREEFCRSQPFLGVPFTAKDSIMVKGLSYTCGMLSRKGLKAEHDAEVVCTMRKAGAIPLAVTNVPEMCFTAESDNLLYGRTVNPYDISKTPGGSTGGEGALLASCGTPLSIGTDIGGSIRFPAAFCGTFGHKPTSQWVPVDGCGMFPDKMKGKNICVVGPLARSVADLVTFLETVVPQATNLAAKVAETDLGALKIWWVDGLESPRCMGTEKPVREALHAACCHLSDTYGMSTQKFQWPTDMYDAVRTWGTKMMEENKGHPSMTFDMTNRKGKANLLEEWLRWACGRGRHSVGLLTTLTGFAAAKISSSVERAEESPFHWRNVKKYFLETLGSNGVLLLPVFPRTAPFHYEMLFYIVRHGGFTLIFSATEMPGTVVPLGLSNDGLPLAVQVITTPNNDHLSLAVAAALEEKFGGWVSPSKVNVSH